MTRQGQLAAAAAAGDEVPAAAHRPPDPRYMLKVRDLRVHFPTDHGLVKAVDGVSFRLERGRTLGIVGWQVRV